MTYISIAPFPSLSHADKHLLNRAVSLPEIKITMFQIGPQKAPRPDGQIPILFQKYWEFMQGPVWRFVQMSLEKRSFPKDLNQSKSWR